MSKLKDLQAQIAALQAQVEDVRKTEVGEAIAKIHAIIAEYDLKASDIFPSRKAAKATKRTSKVAAKYKDPISGKTWTGRGITPNWLKGKNKDDYAIS